MIGIKTRVPPESGRKTRVAHEPDKAMKKLWTREPPRVRSVWICRGDWVASSPEAVMP